VSTAAKTPEDSPRSLPLPSLAGAVVGRLLGSSAPTEPQLSLPLLKLQGYYWTAQWQWRSSSGGSGGREVAVSGPPKQQAREH